MITQFLLGRNDKGVWFDKAAFVWRYVMLFR